MKETNMNILNQMFHQHKEAEAVHDLLTAINLNKSNDMTDLSLAFTDTSCWI